jgi:two-component system CheB/CheR fusion protein
MKPTQKKPPRPRKSPESAGVRKPSRLIGRRVVPIVGIGASAGGLEAFTQLLKQLPVDTGLGFVLVQHLDPQHASALTQLLTRVTSMPVREVTNNLRVAANHVYIIPPNTRLGIARGVLKLQPRPQDRVALRSIDFFFEALAKDQRERAIGVILSGTANDGTLGLEAIKAEGGLTFAQDESAKYDSMPRSAVTAGCVDLVLSPVEIAKELTRIARHPYVAGQSSGRLALPGRGVVSGGSDADTEAATTGPHAEDGYKKILLLLRNHCGVDFSLYKTTTIHRRITRRTVLNRQDSLESYAEFLQGNTQELDALYSDSLIGVTSFFRNAEAFEVLAHKVFPKLLQQRSNEPLRVWVLGCSTGQEAYSIAMSFAEAAEKAPRARKLQVFATDLNEANLSKARHGLYARSLAQDVSPERLRRFFVEEDGGYRVIKSLRESVVFARQNIISDPPFSRMDLISCRNLMIYLEPSLQKKALPTFHYALKPEGFLFLGASESIGSFTDLFESVDKKQKIFSKKVAPTLTFPLPISQGHGERPVRTPAARGHGDAPGMETAAFRGELNAEREADRVTVNLFAPPSVLINADLQILQFRGPTGAYLEPPTGKASFDLLKMARDGLMLPLRAAINQARKDNQATRVENVSVRQNGEIRTLAVDVVPLKNLKEGCFLVFFKDTDRPANNAWVEPLHAEPLHGAGSSAHALGKTAESARIVSLERELAESRDYLQSIQETQEAANEELQASNEEGQSANEELQSLNEELETSKEELESSNEELTTVNEEMVSRNTELNRLNGDLTNLQTSTRLVIVLLGRDQTIRRFSPQAEKQFSLLASDIGRPLGEIRHNLDLPDLSAVIAEVISSERECEREVRDRSGRWFSLRVRPYLTLDNKVDGAVLVLMDIDDLKKPQDVIKAEHAHTEAILRTVPNPLVILSADLRVQSANDAFYRTFHASTAATVGRSFFELDRGAWNVPSLRQLLKHVVSHNSFFDDFEVTRTFESTGRRSLLLNARMLKDPDGKPREVLLGIQDVTEVVTFQTELRRSERRYRRLFEAAQDGILMLDPKTRKITEANPYIVNLLGYSRAQLIQKELWEIGLLKDKAASQKAFRALRKNGFIRYDDLPLKSRQGQRREVEFVSNLYRENGHEVIQCNVRDITGRKQAEAKLHASEERYRTLFGSMDEGFCVVELLFNKRGKAVDYRFLEVNPPFAKLTGLRAATGKRVLELVPDFDTYWFDVYGKVALTGKPVRVVNEVKALGRWFDVYAFRIGGAESRKVAILFSNITERKKTEAALLNARTELSHYTGQLEKLVGSRTAELTAANRQLEISVESIKKGKAEEQKLLTESQLMQKKLRQLTHQILTAQEDERKHISRELHDEVVQTLVGINVELSALAKGAPPGVRGLKEKIAHTQRLVENSVNAVHRFARELRPAVLDDLGLIPALHAHSKNLAARKKISIQITAFRGVEALDAAARTVLFRVAQEALTNVVRHAHATQISLNISKLPRAIQMEINDNGRSFQVEKVLLAKNQKRLGLIGMKERIEMIGGTLVIESAPGRGTTVRAEIPFIREQSKTKK